MPEQTPLTENNSPVRWWQFPFYVVRGVAGWLRAFRKGGPWNTENR